MTGGPSRFAAVCVLLLGFALLVAPALAHIDDTDAQLYQVVARNMAADGRALHPSYLPTIYPQFREHLPFGFWPAAGAVALFGESSLLVLGTLFSLALLLVVGWGARRLAGPWAAVVAMLVLATTDSFFVYGARYRLDPLLVLAAAAGGLVHLVGEGRRSMLLAGVLAAFGVLVKGPFGLVPLLAAIGTRLVLDRSLRGALMGGVSVLLAIVPLTAFLLWDRTWGDGSWWAGYVQGQLLASASGARTDGTFAWWYPLQTLSQRFWPGFALVVVGLVLAVRRNAPRALRAAALFAVLCVAALCLPARKVWNHALVAYPALAVLGGVAVAPWLERVLAQERRARVVAWSLGGLAVVAWVAVVLGLGTLFVRERCVGSLEFASELDRLPSGSPIVVVSEPPSWRTYASLAAERGLVSWPNTRLPAASDAPEGAQLALCKAASCESSDWEELSRARGWVLLRRR